MNQEEFNNNYAELRPFLVGYGRRVAELAGVPYFTYRNALSGQITNPQVLADIYNAMLLLVKERAEALIVFAENSEL